MVCLGLLQVSPLPAQEPKLRATLKGHTGAVVAVAFSPDSKTVASASYDGTLKLWDMTTGKERATLEVVQNRRVAEPEIFPVWRLLPVGPANIHWR